MADHSLISQPLLSDCSAAVFRRPFTRKGRLNTICPPMVLITFQQPALVFHESHLLKYVMNLEIYLTRHGQTEFNATGKIQGWCDSPLTQSGQQEARRLGDKLKNHHFDAIFSSPLPRAVHTAQLVSQGAGLSLPVIAVDDLREYHFGSFEGQVATDAHRQVARALGFADLDSWLHTFRHINSTLMIQGVHRIDPEKRAETEEALLARLYRGLHHAVSHSPAEGRILVVSHGMAIAALLKSMLPDAATHLIPPNSSVSRLHFDGQTFHALSMGQTEF